MCPAVHVGVKPGGVTYQGPGSLLCSFLLPRTSTSNFQNLGLEPSSPRLANVSFLRSESSGLPHMPSPGDSELYWTPGMAQDSPSVSAL